jgi:hypothetical protein
MLPFALGVYIVDSTKTFLSADKPTDALSFLQHIRALHQGASPLLLDEAELMVRFKLGQIDEAMALMESPSWNREGAYGKLVRVTYRVALLAASGAVETARQLALQLKERVLAPSALPAQDQRVLRYLQYFGGVLQNLGLPEDSARVWRKGLAASQVLEDVPIRLALLESLINIEGAREANELASERSVLLGDCMYTSLMASRGLPVAPPEDAEPLFERLHGHLEEVVSFSMSREESADAM